eukprot:TRINITY_DN857_c0_g1_i1.p1 TRINITY_DN857_c0_g1~~TRINITY_DN857_c0_g1_i1.p1  ORF type:complete len:454 (-),score=74.67 TRINITY_DN857_c0_g1_i1:1104-2465(-)
MINVAKAGTDTKPPTMSVRTGASNMAFWVFFVLFLLSLGWIGVHMWMLATIFPWNFVIVSYWLAMLGTTIFMFISCFFSGEHGCNDKCSKGSCIKIGVVTFFYALAYITTFFVITFMYRPQIFPMENVDIHHIGHVSDTQVKMMWRNPTESVVSIDFRVVGDDRWLTTGEIPIDVDDDSTISVTLNNLSPDTEYQYRPFWGSESLGEIRTFRTTVSSSTPTKFSFVVSSCVYKIWQDLKGFETALDQSPDFLVHVGDFIYTDQPWFPVEEIEFYRAKYRYVYTDVHVRKFVENVPVYFMYDDHEIVNNWDKKQETPYGIAIKAWNEYCGSCNPENPKNQAWFTFDRGLTSFFVLDVRGHRSPTEQTDSSSKTMLGIVQLRALEDWLLEVKDTAVFKILISPVPWSGNIRDTDTWGRGYLNERNQIFEFIKSNNVNGVVLFSADRHYAAAFKLE